MGLPVSNVAVFIRDAIGADLSLDARRSTGTTFLKTSARGEFLFALPPGSYDLLVVPDFSTRYLTQTVYSLRVNTNMTCDVNLSTGSIVEFLPRSVSGELINAAELVAYGIEPTTYSAAALRELDGSYSMKLPRGRYHVALCSNEKSEALSEVTSKHATFVTEVQSVDVTGDDTVEISVPVLVSLSGKVTDMFGIAAEGAAIEITPSMSSHSLLARELKLKAIVISDQSGHFEISVLPGYYDINIVPSSSGRLIGMSEENVDVTAHCTKTFKLAEGHRLRGQINWQDEPLPDCSLRIWGLDRKIEATATTDGDGKFSVNLPAGSYRVVATAAKKGVDDPVTRARLAPWSRTVVVGGDTIVAARMQSGSVLSLRVASTEGPTRPGVNIHVFADAPDGENIRTALASGITDFDGNVNFNLAPGLYYLVLDNDWESARTLEVNENITLLSLIWNNWYQLHFNISGSDGRRVPRCRVICQTYGRSIDENLKTAHITFTDDEGDCKMYIPAGVYTLKFDPQVDGSFEPKSVTQLSVNADYQKKIVLARKPLTE